MTTNRKLLEVVAILAAYPLEEFAMEGKADDYPLFGANDWKLLVGHVRRAREALEEEKETPSADAEGWISHDGGAAPDAVYVDIRLRDGSVYLLQPPNAWIWKWSNEVDDVVAYRIAK